MTGPRSGGRILVDQLVAHGAELVFCVPGESYLAALDALHDTTAIRLIVGRMEAGTANMACAHGQLSGRPGVFFATRGPGATQASVAVHTARQGSIPLIVLVGQVPRSHRGREAFQEVDLDAMFAPLAKWAATIDDPARIPEYVARAYRVATAGRPGPVVLSLPEDVLTESAEVADAPPRATATPPAPTADQLTAVRELVGRARRPLVVVGGGGWSQRAARDAEALCEAWELPLATAFRCQDYVDNESRVYCGTLGLGIDPRLAARVADADMLLAIGARLDEPTSGGYSMIRAPRPSQALIHVHADPDELGRVFEPSLAVCAGSAEFLAAARGLRPPDGGLDRRTWTSSAAGELDQFRTPPATSGDGIDLARAVCELREALAPETIVTNGAGNYTLWVHRFWRYTGFGTQLAPVSGAMGYGLPAGIAAKLAHPDRPVVSFSGDGCFMMACQELATAVRHEASVVFVVVDNGSYGTIRMHQERRYPGRPVGTSLRNPDFVALARSFGLDACSVSDPGELVRAVRAGVRAERPSLVHVPISPDVLTPAAAALAAGARA